MKEISIVLKKIKRINVYNYRYYQETIKKKLMNFKGLS